MAEDSRPRKSWKIFAWGFISGAIFISLFFYFGGVTTISRTGQKVEKRIQRNIEKSVKDTGKAIDKTAEEVKKTIQEKLK